MGLFDLFKSKEKRAKEDAFMYYGMGTSAQRRGELKKRDEYLNKAIEMNEPHAKIRMAKIIMEERTLNEANLHRVIQYFSEAESQGCLLGGDDLFQYARAYYLLKDYTNAMPLFQRAAEAKDAMAQYNLGYFYQKGIGVDLDYQKAAYWYHLASEQGKGNATNNLGVIYEEGLGVNKNPTKAFDFYMKASSQKDILACGNIARFYYTGLGVKKDDNKALEWAKKAGNKNNARWVMAMLQRDGKVVRKDLMKAVEELRDLAENEDYNAAKEVLPEVEKEVYDKIHAIIQKAEETQDLRLLDEIRQYGKSSENIKSIVEEWFQKAIMSKNVEFIKITSKALGKSAMDIDSIANQWYKEAIKNHDYEELKKAADLNHIEACRTLIFDTIDSNSTWGHNNCSDVNELISRFSYYEALKKQYKSGQIDKENLSEKLETIKHDLDTNLNEIILSSSKQQKKEILSRLRHYDYAFVHYSLAVLYFEDKDYFDASLACQKALECQDKTKGIEFKLLELQDEITKHLGSILSDKLTSSLLNDKGLKKW